MRLDILDVLELDIFDFLNPRFKVSKFQEFKVKNSIFYLQDIDLFMSVSAIVCAYNEEKTIGPILEVLLSHPEIDEVIAVDDGSTDRTKKVIASIKTDKLVKIHHPKNLGKGAAIAAAVRNATGEILLLIDADLKKFHPAHINLLLSPLEIDQQIMTIGIRETGSIFEQNFKTLLKSFGGERAIAKKMISPIISRIESSGYGVETIINLYHLQHNRKIIYIPLPGLFHKTKLEKHPFYKYAADYIKENAEVIKQFLNPENKVLETFFRYLIKRLGL